MNCQQICDRLPLHVYGDVTAEERSAIEAHVKQCPACAAELSALLAVRRGLDAVPATKSNVDVARLFRAENDRLRQRSQRWRVATLAAIAATALVLALRLEVRVGAGQMTVRWGEPEALPAPVPAPVAVVRAEPVMPPQLEERLKTLQQLIVTLAESADAGDRSRQEQ